MSRSPAGPAENKRIDSWKEIAAFFGRDERTAKRWEKERGLPVHRFPGERGSVFAWSHELTDWLNSSAASNPIEPPPAQAIPQPVAPLPEPAPRLPAARRRRAIGPRTAALLLACATAVALPAIYWYHSRAGAAHARSASAHVPDAEAQQLYLKGRYYWSHRTAQSLSQAIDAFTQAVVHDSDYAQAYAGLAECYDLMPEFASMPGSEAFPRAIAAARKAISLDDSLGEAHRALGFALFYWEWKVPAALTEYQRALNLDPRDEEAHHWYATSLLGLGRVQEARTEIDTAQQLNPASRSILSDQALIHFLAGDQSAAVARLREIEQTDPDFLSAPRYLAYAAFTQKDYPTFIAQSTRFATLSGDKQLLTVAQAADLGFHRGGERAMLESMRVIQQRYFDSRQSSGFELARTCALLGRKQDAVKALEGAIAAHDYAVLEAPADPNFNNLAADPSFQDLIRQITERAYRA